MWKVIVWTHQASCMTCFTSSTLSLATITIAGIVLCVTGQEGSTPKAYLLLRLVTEKREYPILLSWSAIGAIYCSVKCDITFYLKRPQNKLKCSISCDSWIIFFCIHELISDSFSVLVNVHLCFQLCGWVDRCFAPCMILTDMICNDEIKFLWFYTFKV